MTGTTATRDFLASNDTSVAPPSLKLPISLVEVRSADGPIPGTVPATSYDAHRPLQALPNPEPAGLTPPRDLNHDAIAAQFATVARSRAKVDRARAYANRLGAHAAEIRTKLAAAAERQVAAAIGRAEPDPAEVGPLRGEAVEVDRQHRQALAILADVEAEHARHEADLAALCGSDGTARAKLAEAHATRAEAQTAVNNAKAILDRATAHVAAVRDKLTAARADEARHDAEAAARLRAALAHGDAAPVAAEPLVRASGALEDDLRAATAAMDALQIEHGSTLNALAAAHRIVLAAVDRVLMVDAEAVARELQAVDSRAMALRVRLHTYSNRRAGDWTPPKTSPAKMMPGGWLAPDPANGALAPLVQSTSTIGHALASGPLPPHQGVFARNWTDEGEAWTAYAAALNADPQAEPTFSEEAAVPPAPPIPAPRVA